MMPAMSRITDILDISCVPQPGIGINVSLDEISLFSVVRLLCVKSVIVVLGLSVKESLLWSAQHDASSASFWVNGSKGEPGAHTEATHRQRKQISKKKLKSPVRSSPMFLRKSG